MGALRLRPSVWLSGPGATPAVLAATGRPWLAVLALGLVICLLGLTLMQDLRSQERREQAALLLASMAKEANADPAAVLRALQPDASGAGAIPEVAGVGAVGRVGRVGGGGAEGIDDRDEAIRPGPACERRPWRGWSMRTRS